VYLVVDELELTEHTVIDWYNFARDVCQTYNHQNVVVLGGLNPDITARVVEIDETVLQKRKYNRGMAVPQRCIFGIIERDTKRCCIQYVPDRRASTLLPIIEDGIAPGSRIMSDGLASYSSISFIGNGSVKCLISSGHNIGTCEITLLIRVVWR
jgi:hypothetical protein